MGLEKGFSNLSNRSKLESHPPTLNIFITDSCFFWHRWKAGKIVLHSFLTKHHPVSHKSGLWWWPSLSECKNFPLKNDLFGKKIRSDRGTIGSCATCSSDTSSKAQANLRANFGFKWHHQDLFEQKLGKKGVVWSWYFNLCNLDSTKAHPKCPIVFLTDLFKHQFTLVDLCGFEWTCDMLPSLHQLCRNQIWNAIEEHQTRNTRDDWSSSGLHYRSHWESFKFKEKKKKTIHHWSVSFSASKHIPNVILLPISSPSNFYLNQLPSSNQLRKKSTISK